MRPIGRFAVDAAVSEEDDDDADGVTMLLACDCVLACVGFAPAAAPPRRDAAADGEALGVALEAATPPRAGGLANVPIVEGGAFEKSRRGCAGVAVALPIIIPLLAPPTPVPSDSIFSGCSSALLGVPTVLRTGRLCVGVEGR